jgi:tol-pal system protein YbgF
MSNRIARAAHLIAVPGAVVLALLIAGCAPSGEVQQVQGNESVLRGMIASDHQEIAALQEQVGRLNDRLAEIEHNGAAEPDSTAALQRRLTKLESQIASMQPAAGTAAPGAPAGAPDTTGATAGTSGAPGAAPGGEVASAGPTTGAPPGPVVPPLPVAQPPPVAAATVVPTWQAALSQELATRHGDPADRLYRAGLVDMKAGKYAPALAKFQDVQRRYPKSQLSEPAEFFAANALYESGKFDQSILQFNDLTMRFPNGRFASAALLREAQAFMKINDGIDARLTLQKLLNDHPDAPEAASARSMMQALASS